MKARDRSIRLIGWGDRGREGFWAPDMLKRAGEYLDYIAIHMMGQSPRRPDTVLKGLRYQREPERAWEELIELSNAVEKRVSELEQPWRTGLAGGDRDHRRAPEPGARERQSDSARVAVGGVPRAVPEHLSAARRPGEDRDGGGLQWQPVDQYRGDDADAARRELPDAGGIDRAAVQEAQRRARSGGEVGAGGPGYRGQPDRRQGVAARGQCGVPPRAWRRAFAVDGMRVTGGRVFEIAPEDLRTDVNRDQPEYSSRGNRRCRQEAGGGFRRDRFRRWNWMWRRRTVALFGNVPATSVLPGSKSSTVLRAVFRVRLASAGVPALRGRFHDGSRSWSERHKGYAIVRIHS